MPHPGLFNAESFVAAGGKTVMITWQINHQQAADYRDSDVNIDVLLPVQFQQVPFIYTFKPFKYHLSVGIDIDYVDLSPLIWKVHQLRGLQSQNLYPIPLPQPRPGSTCP